MKMNLLGIQHLQNKQGHGWDCLLRENFLHMLLFLGVTENMKPVVLRYREATVWRSELPLTTTNYTLLKLCGAIISNLFETFDQLWKATFFPFHFQLDQVFQRFAAGGVKCFRIG